MMIDIRVRIPTALLAYKELLSVGIRHLAACEVMPKLRKEDTAVKQCRVKISSRDREIVRVLAGRPGWSESSVIWAALVMGARSQFNPAGLPSVPGHRRATDRGAALVLGPLAETEAPAVAAEPASASVAA